MADATLTETVVCAIQAAPRALDVARQQGSMFIAGALSYSVKTRHLATHDCALRARAIVRARLF